MKIKNIILVSIGNFQEYIIYNIKQLLLLNFKVYIITNKKFFPNLDNFKNNITLVDADNLSINFPKKDNFRNLTSKRFFLIYEFMKIKNLTNVIHLENDVLLYSDLDFEFQDKIYLTMDSENRCIPSIIFIPKYNYLDNLIKNYQFKINDMTNLSIFFHNNENIVETFPIINNSFEKSIYNKNFTKFNSIFDAAAIGQYIGGVDPNNVKKGQNTNTVGFVNETCIIKYNNYSFEWKKKGNFYYPYIIIDDKLLLINNLHIHCKKLENFNMENPFETKYIKYNII
jgi:hypothetical protein